MSTKVLPYTATSTTAYFGSRCQPHIKDININPKVSNYQPDGYGRDTYIKVPNGGFRHTWNNNYRTIYYNKKSLTEYIKNVNINPKFPIYKSNGGGRDSYIYYNCGGFYQTKKNNDFSRNLRNYQPYETENVERAKYDYNRYVKMFRSPKEIEKSKSLAKLQRATSARLSKPKNQKNKEDVFI